MSSFWQTPGVDPNLVDLNLGNTPLQIAANQGRNRCVQLLLADPCVDVTPSPLLSASPPLAPLPPTSLKNQQGFHVKVMVITKQFSRFYKVK